MSQQTMEKSIERRAAEWALGESTGASSKAIARHMMGLPDKWMSYPSDGGDLGRCIGLLDAVPEWRARLPEMSAYSPAWAALVKHWDELETKRRAGVDVYDRMKEILRKPESSDKNLIKLGDGVSIRFGR